MAPPFYDDDIVGQYWSRQIQNYTPSSLDDEAIADADTYNYEAESPQTLFPSVAPLPRTEHGFSSEFAQVYDPIQYRRQGLSNIAHAQCHPLDGPNYNPRVDAWPGATLKTIPNNAQQAYTRADSAPEQHQPTPFTSPPLDGTYNKTPPTFHSNFENPSNGHSNTMIGTIHMTPGSKFTTFRCADPACYQKSFTRWPDLDRHRKDVHRTSTELFWCDAPHCGRNRLKKTKPFYRKDKLADHVRLMHGR